MHSAEEWLALIKASLYQTVERGSALWDISLSLTSTQKCVLLALALAARRALAPGAYLERCDCR